MAKRHWTKTAAGKKKWAEIRRKRHDEKNNQPVQVKRDRTEEEKLAMTVWSVIKTDDQLMDAVRAKLQEELTRVEMAANKAKVFLDSIVEAQKEIETNH